MVGMYEPYVEVCRRLAELYPGRRRVQERAPELGRRGGRERGQDRARGDRPPGGAFDRAFHGRTLLTMSLTSKVVPYKRGFGPFAPEVSRPAPYESALGSTRRSTGSAAVQGRRRPASVACVVLEPVQGEGGFIAMPPDFPRRLQELCAGTGSSTSTTRCRPASAAPAVWAIEHYGVTPDLLVSGKSLGGGLPLAAVTGRAELMDAVAQGLGGRSGQPGRLRRLQRSCSTPSRRRVPSRPRRSADDIRARLRARRELECTG